MRTLPLLLALFAVVAHAQSLNAHAGDYEWVGSQSERESIASAIETAVATMNSLTANVARIRLASSNQPVERLSVRFETDDTVLRFDDTEVRIPTTGSRRLVGPGGERGRASQEISDHELKLHFRSPRGARHVTLDFRGDQLVMKVRIESPHLDTDVRYSLTYRRA